MEVYWKVCYVEYVACYQKEKLNLKMEPFESILPIKTIATDALIF